MRFLFFLILFIACDIKEVKDDSIVAKVGEYELKNSDLANAELEIKEGLKLGDHIVISGAGYLKDGDRVKVIESN